MGVVVCLSGHGESLLLSPSHHLLEPYSIMTHTPFHTLLSTHATALRAAAKEAFSPAAVTPLLSVGSSREEPWLKL